MNRSSKIKRGRYITVMKSRNEVRSNGRSLASGAVTAQRRDDSAPNEGMTRSEFDAIRRKQEREDLEKLQQLRLEHDEHERKIRQDAIIKRKSENGQDRGAVEFNCDSTFDSQIQGEDQR